METIMSHPLFWLLLIGGLAFLAVLPTLIALARGADEIALIMLFNALACATIFGWPLALWMAIRWPRRDEVKAGSSRASHGGRRQRPPLQRPH
ncbi:hypothetical protein ACFQ07_33950 [Actinomadura adrarensis]|uniref:Superinfection immunity protein n=1 Tax=Actinomadura adrarensis TaxID=1819600 RepID=A0ABW3CU07_9ACTN